jgi:hypothetical protein
MPAFPRCAALLRNGQPCNRTVAADSEFCGHHTKLLATVDAETLRNGRTPKKRAIRKQMLRVVPDDDTDVMTPAAGTVTNVDPATVRPSLAVAAAENVEQLKASLLEAAGSAARPIWLTVECAGCGERSRVEAPVPDVRARVAAIELLLREGLGRPGQAEEPSAPRLPETVGGIRAMSWEDMEYFAATFLVDELMTVQRDGGEQLLRRRVAELRDSERRVLREALAEPA